VLEIGKRVDVKMILATQKEWNIHAACPNFKEAYIDIA
jgi:hypothetical protein